VQPHAGQQPDAAGVDRQRSQRREVELREPANRRTATRERPHLVEEVVVHDRQFDGDHRRDEWHGRHSVQQEEKHAVDRHPGAADHGEPACPPNIHSGC
jgi:hypothetical protein